MDEHQDLHTAVAFLKALADENRLRIVGLLAAREHSVDELAALLGLTAPTVSHHLTRLKRVGLLRMRPEGTTHLYALDGEALRQMNRAVLSRERIAALAEDVTADAWERKVLRDFLDGDRLKEIPASRKKRQVILKWLVDQFEPSVRYPEAEVNEIIKRHHPDAATLRREFIASKLMQRENGVYWRVPTTAEAQASPSPEPSPIGSTG